MNKKTILFVMGFFSFFGSVLFSLNLERAGAISLVGGETLVLYDAALNATYPPATLARLAEVKRRYDPDNFFRSNLNVQPAAGGGVRLKCSWFSSFVLEA